MKVFIVVSSLLAVATAAPQLLTQRLYAAIPATTYIAAPAEVSSQFHAQDGLGQYTYGYNGGLSAKTEAKSLDGVTRGAYHYLDAENKLQTVTYTADAVNGFRAEASNLPVAPVETRVAPEPVQDTPEVMQAKAEHMSAVEEAKVRLAAAEKDEAAEVVESAEPAPAVPAIAPITTYSAIAAPAPIALAAPASGFAYQTSSVALKNEPLAITTYAAAPVPAAAVEIKTPASFSYSTYSQTAPAAIQYAAAPLVHALPYTALNVQAAPATYTYSYGAPTVYTTNTLAAAPITFTGRALPAPVAAAPAAGAPAAADSEVVESAAANAALPEPVQDTPEVAQAKADFLQTFEQVKARNAQ